MRKSEYMYTLTKKYENGSTEVYTSTSLRGFRKMAHVGAMVVHTSNIGTWLHFQHYDILISRYPLEDPPPEEEPKVKVYPPMPDDEYNLRCQEYYYEHYGTKLYQVTHQAE